MSTPPLAPLVVGVTGHRDLREEDLDTLRQRVEEIFDEHCRPATPLIVISPLAEGADRLVAQIALKRGGRLVVILPMDKALYEEDFKKKPNSQPEFDALLRKAEAVFTLPHFASVEKIKARKSKERKQQYALVGACVARLSHLLLALWDGEPKAGTGGPEQIVQFQRAGYFKEEDLQKAFHQLKEPLGPGSDPLTIPEPGLVIHIVTPRESNPDPERAFQVSKLVPVVNQATEFSNTLKATHERLSSFNKDLIHLRKVTARERRKAQNHLLPPTDAFRLPKTLRDLRKQQAGADALAVLFQSRTRHTVFALGFLVFLAASGFAYHTTLAPEHARENPWSLALYLLLLASAGGVYLFSEIRRIHSKYLDYRAVAEGLRVQFYWSLAGLSKSAADHYLRWQRSELEWIRDVLRSWRFMPSTPLLSDSIRLVQDHWIGGQAKYFRRRAPENRNMLLALSAARNTFLLTSLGFAVYEVLHQPRGIKWLTISAPAALLVTLGMLIWLNRSELRPSSWSAFWSLILGIVGAALIAALLGAILWWLRNWLVVEKHLDRKQLLECAPDSWRMVVMGLSAVAGALVYGYAEVMALSDEAKQYERMEKIFGSALQKPINPELLEALGKEALAENGEWVLMHREKPVEMPYA